MQTLTSVRIDGRYNGPPDSANGGYACGVVAGLVDAPAVAVRLHAPPPVDTDLPAEIAADGTVTVTSGEVVVATARPAARLDGLLPPVVPSVAEAREAMRAHPWFGVRHMLSDCFVCGPGRHDGLGLTFGALPGHPEINGALLFTDATLPMRDGTTAPEIVWAALDCPSYVPALARGDSLALLGALHAELLAPVELGEPVVCVGWPEERDGRKHVTASALLGADGRMLARARAVWIELRA